MKILLRQKVQTKRNYFKGTCLKKNYWLESEAKSYGKQYGLGAASLQNKAIISKGLWLLILAIFIFSCVISSPHAAFANSGKKAYIIKKGDTLNNIAAANFTDCALLAAMNNLDEAGGLQVGQKIYLPLDPEYEVEVGGGDNIWGIARKYQIAVKDLINYNNLLSPDSLKLGQKILVPVINAEEEPKAIAVQAIASRGANLQQRVAAVAAAALKPQKVSKPLGGSAWFSPLHGVISSPFGRRPSGFHHGLDIAADTGTKIKAAKGGKVILAGWKNRIYGYAVEIDHGNGWKTVYGHTSKVLVKVGAKVRAGQVIALVGSTGNSTGPHLHLEIHKDGTVINPLKYIKVTAK